MMLTIVLAVLLILGFLAFCSFSVLYEFERAVVFTLGRFSFVKGPGIIFVIPVLQTMRKVDVRLIVWDIPTQDVVSRDNVSLQVNAVLYFSVVDPQKAIVKIEDYFEATNQLAQTTLRSVLGQYELDVILAEREKINESLAHILEDQTEEWGVRVENVEIKQLDLNESMVRALAKQAEAERDRRAKIIHAEGELQASEKLSQAAQVMARNPNTMTLRYLQTLATISTEQNSTIIFPLPIEIMSMIDSFTKKKAKG